MQFGVRNIIRLLIVLVAATFSLSLVFWLGRFAEVNRVELTRSATGLSLTEFATIIFWSLIQLFCGALKWRAVMQRIAPERSIRVGMRFFLFYTCLGAVAAQLLTVYLSSLLVRGLAARWHQRLNFSHGAATSIYEQTFDVVVMLAVAIPTLVALLAGWNIFVWSFSVAISIFTMGIVLAAFFLSVTPVLSRWAMKTSRNAIFAWVQTLFLTCSSLGLLEMRLIARLYSLSLLRYAATLMMVLTIVIATGYPFTMSDVILAFPIVQSAQLIALTPGNLGIAEWTWAGVLVAFGYDLATAGEFALVARILAYASILVITLLVALPYLFGRFLRPRA